MKTVCVIGIAGYSGSGKTTLIECLLPELNKKGLRVGVLKHVHHNLEIDTEGKDTDRFFRAGADLVVAHDDRQVFARGRYRGEEIHDILAGLPAGLDLIIVEGYKGQAVPGIWLEKKKTKSIVRAGGKEVIFRDDPQYVGQALSLIHEKIESFHAGRVIHAGLLVGGKSTRMGRPKALLKIGGMPLAERSFNILSEVSGKALLLGSGQIPECLDSVERLPDVQGINGPLAGMLSAFRWAPQGTWIISSVDMPLMHRDAWLWLLNQRKPGIWAILPRLHGGRGVETTGAVYEPMIFEHMESISRKGVLKLQEIAKHPKVITPLIPRSLAPAWKNVNTAEEWKSAMSSSV